MDLSGQADHHPLVTFSYNNLTINLVTHDAGNKITEKDIELAKAIDEAILRLVV